MCAFKMKVSNEKIKGLDTILPGQYDVKLVGFNPKLSKAGDSTNLNACMEIVNHPDFMGRKLYDNMNTPGGAFYQSDFVHCFGLPMDTDGTTSWIPGDWDKDKAKFKEDDPTTYSYEGPLVGRIGKVEVGVDSFGSKIARYFCAVADCNSKFPDIKHYSNLLKKG